MSHVCLFALSQLSELVHNYKYLVEQMQIVSIKRCSKMCFVVGGGLICFRFVCLASAECASVCRFLEIIPVTLAVGTRNVQSMLHTILIDLSLSKAPINKTISLWQKKTVIQYKPELYQIQLLAGLAAGRWHCSF